jgi:uncharacterized protein YbbK (DUF523 family)
MILVSACLSGYNCRYNGSNCTNVEIKNLVKDGKAIPICPEVLGGLSTPREPMEIVIKNNDVCILDKYGNDYTYAVKKGSAECLKLAKLYNINHAVLKSKSPSCGFGEIYDGTFKDKLVNGNGITGQLLKDNGIKIYNEINYKEYLKKIL